VVQRRSPARFLAPVAVLVSAGAVYEIVHNGVKDEPASRPATTTTAAPARRTGTRTSYVVRSGDTLSAISERTGISLADLQQMNPTVDANALHAGQKLRLRKQTS
jgi:LysM repeat protein